MKSFFLFRGRLRRRAFWARSVGLYALTLLLYGILGQAVEHHFMAEDWAVLLMIFMLLILLVLMVAQTVRRLHDTNLSGWWWWLLLLPVLGNVFGAGIPLVDGTAGPNRFGPDPKRRTGFNPQDPQN
ncbi:DUF805 domain-containing protein [Hymenobacter sp. J193]|uniref:DUF805 domain-containing protein n=1 Tax=Hymenobacter sp. J193 TaxID=2898429 RepID=UPI002151C23C|nr:DUF805 domain-containing protein [Hymenobacter sp. J193]MCR5888470.1 DUF805 domain-containing protein [Hymenobacter sp. J193]